MTRLSWTQPICNECWYEQEPDRYPTRLKSPAKERCAFCGADTRSGIYVRRDPNTVPFPAEKEG